MSQWVLSGLRVGLKTTRYPRHPEDAPGVTPGLPTARALDSHWRRDPFGVIERCPTGALVRRDDRIDVDLRRCVHCFRCAGEELDGMPWVGGYEWAAVAAPTFTSLDRPFSASVNIRIIDAGDCGACLHEVKQLANPYYNLHRLGFFFTPTPRQADILIVVGPGTDQMRLALEKTFAAMPTPRRVIAAGTCALSGGIFGRSFACSAGVGSIVPVDIEVPGNPPPPLALLHALLVATGRARPTAWRSQSSGLTAERSDNEPERKP